MMHVRRYYVYILASKSRTLYTGVTRDLRRRLYQHHEGSGSGFTRRYGVHRLVHVDTATSSCVDNSSSRRTKLARSDEKVTAYSSGSACVGW